MSQGGNQRFKLMTNKKDSFIQKRLLSLDALRGFDMFWIIGGEGLIQAMAKIKPDSFWMPLSGQFEHPYWNGFTAYDLIFPLFIFLAGVSTPFSVGKALNAGKSRQMLLRKVLGTKANPSKCFMQLEMGVLPVKYVIMQRRIYFLHYLLNQSTESIIFKVFEALKEDS